QHGIFVFLVLTKILRCIGIFFLDILAKGIHVVSLLWLVKCISTSLTHPETSFTWAYFEETNVYTHWKNGISQLFDRSALVLWNHLLWPSQVCVLVFELSPSVLLVAWHPFLSLICHILVSDHQGGIAILFLALLLRIGYDNSFRHLAVEIGGPKRLYSLVTTCSAMILTPIGVLSLVMKTSVTDSLLHFIILLFIATVFVMVLDFYAESVCFQHVADPVMAAARWSPGTMFSCALGLAWLWYAGQGLQEHIVTSGVIITLVVAEAQRWWLIGMSDTGLPLFAYKEAFLQKTGRSLVLFFKETLREILANSDSRRIFWFLCVNLSFCGVEFLYGFWTNSLGLISDGFHMLFDCSALVLSGFINALFLCVIALFILLEALERLFDPPNINTDRLLFVAVSGLLVNLFGMYSFHGGEGDHGHGHSHGGGSHGHSHSGNANMEGVFLHVLADTLGSVFVIISTLLIQWFGWTWVDPLCSLILSVLILGSVYPLLTSSVNTLLQNIPDDEEFEHHLCEALEVDGVKSYSKAHYWQLKSDLNVASVAAQLRAAGATQCSVQVEKDFFTQRIQQLCPSYRFGHNVARGTTIARERKSHSNHGHGHSHNGHDHGHSH
ncbi:cation diffusion facilitator family transporter, partial [Ostertagia ostertagi]